MTQRCFLVLGGHSGLGEHFARTLAARGYPMVVTARRGNWLVRIAQRRLGQLADLDEPLRPMSSGRATYPTGAVLAVDSVHLVSSL